MATPSENPLEQRLLSAQEIKGDVKTNSSIDIVSVGTVSNAKDINIIKPKNKQKSCRPPFNRHDRHLLYMIVGLALLFSGYLFLNKTRQKIVPVK